MFFRVIAAAFCTSALVLYGTAGASESPPPVFKFGLGPHHARLTPCSAPIFGLPHWTGSFTDAGGNNTCFTMVGSDPAKGSATTTIPVYIIPIRMVYGSANGHKVLDPIKHTVKNGLTVIQNVAASPIFDSTYQFKTGKTSLGPTQYVDAFQRGNFWSSVSKNSDYHVLLGSPVMLSEQTISVQPGEGSYGTYKPYIGTMDMATFDSYLRSYIKSFPQIGPGTLPIFVTYNVYLTDNGACCTGGYHSVSGNQFQAQTFAYATYVDHAKDFSQDVSALSHEVGEWMDDPYANNVVTCSDPSINHLLEVADPLEGEDRGKNGFGDYPYKLNGFTYNLQSLAFLPYFGARASTSVNGWTSFHGPKDNLRICPIIATFDPPGSTGTSPTAINDKGAIAGSYYDSNNSHRGFVRNVGGTFSTFDVPGSTNTSVNSINSEGTVAGTYYSGANRGFMRAADGTVTTFDFPGSSATFASSVNAGNSIAGYHYYNSTFHGFLRTPDGTFASFDPSGSLVTYVTSINATGSIAGFSLSDVAHGFVRAPDGTITPIDIPGSRGTEVMSINSDGTIAGDYSDGKNLHGFMRATDGTTMLFDPPGSTYTEARCVNDYGAVTGIYWDGSGATHSYMRAADGTITSFDAPGSVYTEAVGINIKGAITGDYQDSNGVPHGFIGIP